LDDATALLDEHRGADEQEHGTQDDGGCDRDAHREPTRNATRSRRIDSLGSSALPQSGNHGDVPTSDSSLPTGPDEHLTRVVLDAAAAAGIDHVGVADADPFNATREILEKRKADGLHGGMQFTYRNPERSTDPGRSLVGARSLVAAAWRYAERGATPSDDGASTAPVGTVARYARVDAYRPLRRALGEVAAALRSSGHRALVFADDNSMVDRSVAIRAGLGWSGRNTNVLLPGEGSWFVLGSVVTDAWLVPAPGPVDDGCGTCRRCLDGCPTGALVAPGVLDARRCLAWLVQVPGSFPRPYRAALGGHLYGCDDCQEVCPPNQRVGGRRVLSPTRPGLLDLWWLLESGDEQVLAEVGHWYIPERDLRIVRRNALVTLGNAGGPAIDTPAARERTERVLARYLRDDDLLAEHAAWAALRLGLGHLLDLPGVAGRTVVAAELRCWEDDRP
jgi:epoxyqueuosine reductase